MSFSDKIRHWYASHQRDLPWRTTKDPYKIWLSEIMLQQTRVAQGLPYYHKFLRHFPTVQELSEASEKKVLKLWQGLGYYSRARNLHATAKKISGEHGGVFPDTYEALRNLRGVGDYTASAIASICFNRPEPVVDGNVYRVLSRYFGVDTPINSSAGVAYFKKLAREVMDTDHPGEYNQAIMEFGATQCVPASPDCGSCPLNESCVALAQQRVSQLPVKKKKPPVKRRYFNYLIPIDAHGKTQLQQRNAGGIWQQLYEFPLLESEGTLNRKDVLERLPVEYRNFKQFNLELADPGEIVHKLSHQHLHTRFWVLALEGSLQDGICLSELETYPVPVLIADFIKTLKNSYF